MNKMIEHKLETLRKFQANNPTAHVGGSIGLMIRGVNLLRDLSKSDLDITIDEYNPLDSDKESLEQRSDTVDFDFALRTSLEGIYTKIDIRVCPEPSYEAISFEGHVYNVSMLRDILFWKGRYAKNGHLKHKNDLEAIKTGVRPMEPVYDNTDLPF